MLYLEAGNKIVEETLIKAFENKHAPKSGEVNTADFDGTKFVLKGLKEDKSKLVISITTKCGDVLKKYGLEATLKQVYGDYVAETEQGATATLIIPIKDLDEKSTEFLLKEVPLLKRYVMKSLFQEIFTKQNAKEKWESVRIPYRDEESIYVVNSDEGSVVVVYSIKFSDQTDIVLAHTFLKEFKDTRRDRGMNFAPGIRYSVEKKPSELKGVESPEPESKEYGFVSFGLFDSHLKTENINQTIDMLVSFRNYFHYHLKCSKAYMHFKMRDRVQKLLQNLEAAKDKTGIVTQKKTASGRTFTRT